ncbi:hypothetical protein M6G65_06215 [Methylobacterium tardum]|uniref:hypothetical protein n=1 Tax=Methylobacterium tardum TaxID=374432 RepID=UPI0020217F91|nr:hypothetical protein [Methylobacterium tardum]URD38073.1 hypothetical protein M6G65_06215 [Methylobacterium tardum]
MTLRIGTRLQMITATALLGMALLIGLAAWDLSRVIGDARAAQTRTLVEAAHGVLAYFEGEERAGRMSRAAAQAGLSRRSAACTTPGTSISGSRTCIRAW